MITNHIAMKVCPYSKDPETSESDIQKERPSVMSKSDVQKLHLKGTTKSDAQKLQQKVTSKSNVQKLRPKVTFKVIHKSDVFSPVF